MNSIMNLIHGNIILKCKTSIRFKTKSYQIIILNNDNLIYKYYKYNVLFINDYVATCFYYAISIYQ